MNIYIEIVGWCGAILILIAYFLVSQNKLHSNSKLYQYLNLLGAIGVGINVFYQQSWPALGLQVVWALIALKSLLFNKK